MSPASHLRSEPVHYQTPADDLNSPTELSNRTMDEEDDGWVTKNRLDLNMHESNLNIYQSAEDLMASAAAASTTVCS